MSGKMQIKLKVNGEDHEFLAEPRELLVHALRERLNLTGSHVGCETGHCGVCTVTLNGKSVKSCTCLLYTSPSPRDLSTSRMPSSA